MFVCTSARRSLAYCSQLALGIASCMHAACCWVLEDGTKAFLRRSETVQKDTTAVP